ncbi:hypothetical protein BREU_2288 [Bifidobacterium reuteri DSM 23975]|uniref:Uncharacterized protein n=1 Tax=Bifidobacterium reuteri DSM 23975 TaxID=1437610 RepID=A0A087CNQ2_9BIFI|nr:hypothetical protein BREU_2288 [Bifidobacterium reuteri DSM 23975]
MAISMRVPCRKNCYPITTWTFPNIPEPVWIVRKCVWCFPRFRPIWRVRIINLFLATSLVALGRRNMNPRFSRLSILVLRCGCIASKNLRHHCRHTVMIPRSNCISMMLGCWQRPWI